MILGKISTVDNYNGIQLTIDGEDSPTTKKYSYLSSYVPAANDRVIVEEVGGSYVIMGKIISDYASSGVARTAAAADTALTASSATVSDTTKGFDSSVSSATGSIITRVDKTWSSELMSYIITDVVTTSDHAFVYK